jgi:hypothetical protein
MQNVKLALGQCLADFIEIRVGQQFEADQALANRIGKGFG